MYKLFEPIQYSLIFGHDNIVGMTFWNPRFCEKKNYPPPPHGIGNEGFENHDLK